jgi:hypothetical protein
MKKQLLIAAVAASMTSVAMADLSISGKSKVIFDQNSTNVETTISMKGTSGASSVVVDLDLHKANSDLVKNAYVKTDVAGIALKAGQWKSGASNLGTNSIKYGAYNLSTTMGGVKVAYEETGSGSSNSLTVSGSIAGVKLSHKMAQQGDATETKASGSFSGVDLAYHVKDSGTTKNTATKLSTSTNGMTISYLKVDNGGTSALNIDGDVETTIAAGTDLTAFIIGTDIAGNGVEVLFADNGGDKNEEITVTRTLASGANLEVAYNNGTEDLSAELVVKF